MSEKKQDSGTIITKDPHHGEGVNNYQSSLLGAALESTADGIFVINNLGEIVTYNQQ